MNPNWTLKGKEINQGREGEGGKGRRQGEEWQGRVRGTSSLESLKNKSI